MTGSSAVIGGCAVGISLKQERTLVGVGVGCGHKTMTVGSQSGA